MRLVLPLLLSAMLACGDKADDLDEDGDGIEATQDCDDSDATVYPGAVEACDGIDNDCDGVVDDGLLTSWYPDEDDDGYGDDDEVTDACSPPDATVSRGGDCDDDDPLSHPDGVETCDGADNDCDGVVDEGVPDAPTWYEDVDGDGWGSTDPATHVTACDPPSGSVEDSGDCDDDNDAVHPGAIEDCTTDVDEDCDGATPGCR